MIYGIGVDIVRVERFMKHLYKGDGFISEVFPEEELLDNALPNSPTMVYNNDRRLVAMAQHYASRFASKEAYAKALGVGLVFSTKDLYVAKDIRGRPYLCLRGKAKSLLEEHCSRDARDAIVHLSISHESNMAVSYVIIECPKD